MVGVGMGCPGAMLVDFFCSSVCVCGLWIEECVVVVICGAWEDCFFFSSPETAQRRRVSGEGSKVGGAEDEGSCVGVLVSRRRVIA